MFLLQITGRAVFATACTMVLAIGSMPTLCLLAHYAGYPELSEQIGMGFFYIISLGNSVH